MNHQPPLRPDRPDDFNHAPAADDDVGLDKNGFRGTLESLLGEIDALPAPERDRLRGVADATRQRHEQLGQTVRRLQETLDFLRLSIKYLCFDVEATRRENEYLRRMLDEQGGSN